MQTCRVSLLVGGVKVYSNDINTGRYICTIAGPKKTGCHGPYCLHRFYAYEVKLFKKLNGTHHSHDLLLCHIAN